MSRARRPVVTALVVAACIAALSAPVLMAGQCPSGADQCVTYFTNVLGIQVPAWLWIPLTGAAFLVTLLTLTKPWARPTQADPEVGDSAERS
jgi:hypothetical protein